LYSITCGLRCKVVPSKCGAAKETKAWALHKQYDCVWLSLLGVSGWFKFA